MSKSRVCLVSEFLCYFNIPHVFEVFLLQYILLLEGYLLPFLTVSRKWVLPSRHPDGTQVYKNRALRTPFVKVSSNFKRKNVS
jgi:hypothetical protein